MRRSRRPPPERMPRWRRHGRLAPDQLRARRRTRKPPGQRPVGLWIARSRGRLGPPGRPAAPWRRPHAARREARRSQPELPDVAQRRAPGRPPAKLGSRPNAPRRGRRQRHAPRLAKRANAPRRQPRNPHAGAEEGRRVEAGRVRRPAFCSLAARSAYRPISRCGDSRMNRIEQELERAVRLRPERNLGSEDVRLALPH